MCKATPKCAICVDPIQIKNYMQTNISTRILIPTLVLTAIVGLYFISTSSAEAREGSNDRERNNYASSTKNRNNEEREHNRIASSTIGSSNKLRNNIDTTCMSSAVGVRETALITAWTDLNTTLTTSLTDRKTALVSAWALTDIKERNNTMKTVWSDWNKDKKDAHTKFRAERKIAWDAFKKTVKDDCKVTLPKEEAQEKATSDTISI